MGIEQDAYYDGMTPGAQPPLPHEPGYQSFKAGEAQAQRYADRHAEAVGRFQDSVAATTATLFRDGFWSGLKMYLGEMLSAVVGITLLVALISWLTHHNVQRDALVGAGATTVVLTGWGILLFMRYWLGPALLIGVGILILHRLGIVPRFW